MAAREKIPLEKILLFGNFLRRCEVTKIWATFFDFLPKEAFVAYFKRTFAPAEYFKIYETKPGLEPEKKTHAGAADRCQLLSKTLY